LILKKLLHHKTNKMPENEKTIPEGGATASGVQGSDGKAELEISRDAGTSNIRDGNISRRPETETQESPNTKTQEGRALDTEEMNDILEQGSKSLIDRNMVAFNGITIRKSYPKSYQLMVEYMMKVSDLGKIDDETAIGILLYSPRTVLFNFFDSNELRVQINYNDSENTWFYTFNKDNYQAKGYTSRTKAEVDGFDRAFAVLEKRLNSKP
jgi:hypothetical protein